MLLDEDGNEINNLDGYKIMIASDNKKDFTIEIRGNGMNSGFLSTIPAVLLYVYIPKMRKQ